MLMKEKVIELYTRFYELTKKQYRKDNKLEIEEMMDILKKKEKVIDRLKEYDIKDIFNEKEQQKVRKFLEKINELDQENTHLVEEKMNQIEKELTAIKKAKQKKEKFMKQKQTGGGKVFDYKG